jgi:hypothetical protein
VRPLRCLSVLATLAALLPARAMAMGAVVGRSGDLISMSTERVAVATAPSRTTRWAQVSVTGASAGFAWLVPVHPGARLDLASDAWLDALDAATAPVILPPTTPGCIGGSDADLVAPTTSPMSTSPTQTEILTDLPSLTVLLGDAGFPISPELASRLTTVLASGDAIAALLFPNAKLPTHTLRIVDDGTPSLPFALSGTNFGDLAVTGFVVAPGPEAAGTMPITIDPSTVLWVADAHSTYAQAGVVLVQQSQGTRWLTQSSMPGLFFAGAPIGGGASLPAVLSQYFTLSASYGDAVGDAAGCVAASASTQNETGTYEATCPNGALAIVDGPGPCTAAGAGGGGIGVDSLTCGGNSVDAALAVADLPPQQIWVTRLEGMVTLESASDVPLVAGPAATSGPGGSLSPVLTAGGYDCPGAGGGGGGGDPGGGASLGAGTSDPSGASAAADVASNGCAAGLESCSSSDSSSSDSSGGCGSSDSSSSDSGCSGSDAGSGGCSSDGGSSCTTARQARHHRRGRSPVSRILLLGAAIAVVARRYGRGRGDHARKA